MILQRSTSTIRKYGNVVSRVVAKVALAPHLTEGINRVRLVYKNHFGPWTYAYKVTQNKTVMYEGRCGQVWAYGCGFLNFRTGVVHEFKFEISRE